MESQNAEAETGTRGTASVSRWSPTKEQINILENLYKQGIRTPNAEQIQHITCSLRAYGHIEGKNVFYWFQNHKARQRQKLKQKQQTAVAYFNRFLHTSHPISSSPLCQNVVCAPYCFQQSGISFYPQQSKMIAAGDISLRSEQVESLGMPKFCNGQQIYEQLQQRVTDCNFRSSNKKTLTLFPLHPTGIMDGKTTNQMPSLASISDVDEDGPPGNQPFFDFLTSEQRS